MCMSQPSMPVQSAPAPTAAGRAPVRIAGATGQTPRASASAAGSLRSRAPTAVLGATRGPAGMTTPKTVLGA
jgi:hypothetical protein